MKYFLLFFLLTFSSVSSFAQHKVDSLRNVIQSNDWGDLELLQVKLELASVIIRTHAPEAIEICREILDQVEHSQSDSIRAACYNVLGISKVTIGEKDSALYYYFEALKIYEKKGHQLGMAETYNHIARYYRQKDFEKSIDFYEKAMANYTALEDKEGVAIILNESGVAYEYNGQYDTAIARYEASLAIQKERKDSIGIAYSLEFLSGAFALKKELDKAVLLNMEALELRKRLKDTFGLCLNYNSLANIYLNLKDYSQSIVNAQNSQELAEQMEYLEIYPENYNILYRAYQGLQQYAQALEMVALYDLYKDSVYNIKKNKQIEELSFQYETEKNRSLIQQQQFDLSTKNYMLAGIASILLASIIIGILYYRRNKLQQQNEIQRVILQQQEQATKAIIEAEEEERERIARDLHDGVGQMMSAARMNLSAFESRIALNDEEEKDSLHRIIQMVDDSCKEIRTVSHNMMPNSLIKNSLATAIRNFIDKLDKNALNVQLYTDGLDQRIDMNIESVLYRVIQECVNNVIKHAAADRLDISIIREPNEISVTIEDNGKGFDLKALNKKEGIGLKNIKTRIAYLQGSVEFDSALGRGTVVMIHIPVR